MQQWQGGGAVSMHTLSRPRYMFYLILVSQTKASNLAARQWLHDVKELTGLGLNEMWREPESVVLLPQRIA